MDSLRRFINEESGATAIEYGLIVALISVAMVGALTSVGNTLSGVFKNINSNLAR